MAFSLQAILYAIFPTFPNFVRPLVQAKLVIESKMDTITFEQLRIGDARNPK